MEQVIPYQQPKFQLAQAQFQYPQPQFQHFQPQLLYPQSQLQPQVQQGPYIEYTQPQQFHHSVAEIKVFNAPPSNAPPVTPMVSQPRTTPAGDTAAELLTLHQIADIMKMVKT